MQTQTIERYETRALGFPLIIENIKLRRFRDDWVAEVDWTEISEVVMRALPRKPAPLTGNEIRFVRQQLQMTLKAFASFCEVSSHQAVMQWESRGDEPAKMGRATEILLRARLVARASPRATIARVLADVSGFEGGGGRDVVLSLVGGAAERWGYAYR
ncbi:hypothetical protein FRC98_16820 [Lujinxingia vulgaris]|uniref:Uncharacterized protein n=1 Tax=Lujinxingia vulgaris TaxID=2600176 RepID=A0A5C6XCL6_9DELT|nr:hypothetical protein [Lujinxingia vulgaris]TXD35133.1 hypothetical protein FRC98_16820 [Lujinxingia vulgaris]